MDGINTPTISPAEYKSGKYGIYNVKDDDEILYKKISCSGYFKPEEQPKYFIDNLIGWFKSSKEVTQEQDYPLVLENFYAIAKLRIPVGGKIVRARIQDACDSYYCPSPDEYHSSSQVRTDKAFVEEIVPQMKKSGYKFHSLCECHSFYDNSFRYEMNKLHEPKQGLDTNIDVECASGIHGFKTHEDVVRYY